MTPTFYEACHDLTIATRNLIWNYCPETVFAAGFMIGMMVMGMLALVAARGI